MADIKKNTEMNFKLNCIITLLRGRTGQKAQNNKSSVRKLFNRIKIN